MGHEVFVFVPGNDTYQDDEPNVFRAPALPLSGTGYHLQFGFPLHIQQEIETMDVLHVHHPFLVGQYAVNVGKQHHIPIVFTNHSRYHLLTAHYVPLASEDFSWALMAAYLPHFARQCDLTVVPSPGIKDHLHALGVSDPIVVVPNGIDLAQFRNPTAPRSRHDLGLPDDAVIAITVGRLGPEKNLPFLLQAYARIADQVPDLHLIVVGRGPERETLLEMAGSLGLSPRVHLIGEVLYDDVPNWLALADFFALPSVSESHPLVILEALAAGLPVIGIPGPGVEDALVDGLNGLSSPEDVDAFGARIYRLASEPELRAQLADGAWETSERNDIRRTSSALLAHYERLVEERTPMGQLS
jgi:1,2-diacylglycerol 3-alpha-glucosyltransferase